MLTNVQFETLTFTFANECHRYAVVMTVEQNVKMHHIFLAMVDVIESSLNKNNKGIPLLSVSTTQHTSLECCPHVNNTLKIA